MKRFFKIMILFVLSISILVNSVFAVNIQAKGDPKDYIDINGHWAESSINFVIENGYFKGMTKNEFKPDISMSRAMLVTVLWRLTGETLKTTKVVNGVTKTFPKYVNMFWDMEDDAWYTDCVSWANENKIISGYSKREFRPDEAITREQLSTILYNYLKNYKVIRGFESLKVNASVVFADDALISDWAREKVSIIQQIGLMEGRNDGTFDPQATVTRAEIAVVIERLLEIV